MICFTIMRTCYAENHVDFSLTKQLDLFTVKWNQGDKEDHISEYPPTWMHGKENERLLKKHQKPTSGSDPDQEGYAGSERMAIPMTDGYAS